MPPPSPAEHSTDLSWDCHAPDVTFVVQKWLKITEMELNYWCRSSWDFQETKAMEEKVGS